MPQDQKMSIPQWAMDAVASMPEPVQAKVTDFAMRAMADPYVLPLSTIPAAWCLAFVPHFAAALVKVVHKRTAYNNEEPRCENPAEHPFSHFLVRCNGAHLNGLEMQSLFAGAVLTARVSKVKPTVLLAACLRYLKLRAIYTALYLLGVNKVVAAGRTIVWTTACSHALSMYAL